MEQKLAYEIRRNISWKLFFFPQQSLLPGDEILHCSPEIFTTHLIIHISSADHRCRSPQFSSSLLMLGDTQQIFWTALSNFPSNFSLSKNALFPLFHTLFAVVIYTLFSAIAYALFTVIGYALCTFFHILVMEIGYDWWIIFSIWDSRFQEQNDDNHISKHEDEPGTNEGEREFPEILTKKLGNKCQLSGKSRDYDKKYANLHDTEQRCDPLKPFVPKNCVCFLCFDVLEIERLHFFPTFWWELVGSRLSERWEGLWLTIEFEQQANSTLAKPVKNYMKESISHKGKKWFWSKTIVLKRAELFITMFISNREAN